MARSSATRRGNGAGKGDGWGGPAKGASSTRIKPGDPDGITALRHDPEVIAKAEERVALVKANIFRLALEAQREETQLSASVAFLNRELGAPMQPTDVTSKGERVGYVVAAPEEDESPEAWQTRQPQPVLQ